MRRHRQILFVSLISTLVAADDQFFGALQGGLSCMTNLFSDDCKRFMHTYGSTQCDEMLVLCEGLDMDQCQRSYGEAVDACTDSLASGGQSNGPPSSDRGPFSGGPSSSSGRPSGGPPFGGEPSSSRPSGGPSGSSSSGRPSGGGPPMGSYDGYGPPQNGGSRPRCPPPGMMRGSSPQSQQRPGLTRRLQSMLGGSRGSGGLFGDNYGGGPDSGYGGGRPDSGYGGGRSDSGYGGGRSDSGYGGADSGSGGYGGRNGPPPNGPPGGFGGFGGQGGPGGGASWGSSGNGQRLPSNWDDDCEDQYQQPMDQGVIFIAIIAGACACCACLFMYQFVKWMFRRHKRDKFKYGKLPTDEADAEDIPEFSFVPHVIDQNREEVEAKL